LFERLGYGIQPDPLSMKTQFLRSEVAGLYRIQYGPNPYYANRDLSLPLAFLSLWSYVAASDGPVAQKTAATVTAMLEQRFDMEPFEVNRLRAHAGWLAHHPATLNDARRRLGAASAWEPADTGWLLALLATVDAPQSPARIKALAKIYRVLGLSDEQLHADIHRISTGAHVPVQVLDGGAAAGFAVPPESHDVSLDPVQLAGVRRQTDDVSNLLHDVFGNVPESTGDTADAGRSDLERRNAFLEFAEQLVAQPSWQMADVRPMAVELGLMATGAIEILNNSAVELGLDPPIECDDVVCDIDQSTLKELLAHV
jgi:hypothetical protein